VRVSASADGAESMTRVCALEELPRGDRKLVRALGKSILMFWYRDTVFAIESRSPAEGAYSEGFEKARLTQDACIECPTTKSKFDLKTGEIKEWYPENPVLKALTPQDTCRPMEVFPVEVRDDGIYLDAKNGSLGPGFVAPIGLGGSNTSLENNNVFAVETPMYVEGEGIGGSMASGGDSSGKMDASQLGGAIAVAGVVAVAGTGACLYFENFYALAALWIAGFAAAAGVALKTTGALDEE
jgi:nitrite reductase/ring-hydroxylating ferredoxin subunit